MKKLTLIWTLTCILYQQVYTQDHHLPFYEITTDTILNDVVEHPFWQILKDPKGKWTINDVTTPPVIHYFQTDSNDRKSINYSINTVWFRYRIKNVMKKAAKISIKANWEKSELYFFNPNGVMTTKTTGWLYPWNKRDGLRKIHYIPVTLEPGQELLVYNRVYNAYRSYKPSHFSVEFASTEKLINSVYVNNDTAYFSTINNAFLFAILLFATFINLFFYFVVREKVYLYYALFLLSMGLTKFTELTNLLFRNYGELYIYLNWFPVIFYFYFLIRFVRHFLQTRLYFPATDRALKFAAYLQAILFLAVYFIEPMLSGRWSGTLTILLNLSFCAIFTSILVTFIFYLRHRNRSLRVLLIAALPAFIVWGLLYSIRSIFYILNATFGLPVPELIAAVNQQYVLIDNICTYWFVFAFSSDLFFRFSDLLKEVEKQKLEKELERARLIELQRAELEKQVVERTAELKQSLEELKTTQHQLIQSEKMASLGELTAGIAHEIQNPLNFVNNFSEVSQELMEEMEKELQDGNEKQAGELAKDIRQNIQKIKEHGKRADSIVKAMLLHSRANTGQKEPVDLNALTDEYLHLSYQGLRAQDKLFNATIKKDLDPGIGYVMAIRQDLGRLFLNLFNNAFYATSEKRKKRLNGFQPTVSVTTQVVSLNPDGNRMAEIRVKDNGMGIPGHILDKLFQPFFTTKPAGKGTGLGLSLSYDIVTKGHGGHIKVETKEGEFAEFIIQLPLQEVKKP